jgi:hypothetical protein
LVALVAMVMAAVVAG